MSSNRQGTENAATVHEFEVGSDGRIDKVVGEALGFSRRRLVKLFAEATVSVDGRRVRKGDFVTSGQQVRVVCAPVVSVVNVQSPCPQPSALEPIYIDEDRIAINKPAEWTTHPLVEGELDSAANWLVAAYPETVGIGDDPREAGFVHRLDRGTTGVLLAARHRQGWLRLREQFRQLQVGKRYVALVEGAAASGRNDSALVRRGRKTVIADPRDRKSLHASTSWTVRDRLALATLLDVQITTGRMHQIRAHLADAGFPIVGDTLYGGRAEPNFVGHFLHAAQLTIEVIEAGQSRRLTIEAPLPPSRHEWLARLSLG